MSGHDYSGNVRKHEHGGVTWVDVYDPGGAVLEQIAQDYNLHPFHVHESVHRVQHNQVEREKTYLFLVMHFPVVNRLTGKLTVGQLSVFLGKDYLITVHREHSVALDELYSLCTNEAGASEMRSSAYLLYALIRGLLGKIEQMADRVDTELDEIEGLVFEDNKSDAERISRLREKIVRLRRLIGPKKILLQDLAEQIGPFAGKDMTRYYIGNVKTANKLGEESEEAKETVEIYKDADFTTSTEKTNEILAILTLVFTFTIPITVVAGVYGMNVPLPGGVTAQPWMFMGRYTTFVIMVVTSILLAVGMYVYCRRKKWF